VKVIKSFGDQLAENLYLIGGILMRLPNNPFHPGEILLEEFLKPSETTQTAFAKKVGWTRDRLNELTKGKRGITEDSAMDLAKALGTSAKLWMNHQATYDLCYASKRRRLA
jgi:addiction module HigA family antidote